MSVNKFDSKFNRALRKAEFESRPKGPGRPPREQPREALTIRAEPSVANDFRKLCVANKRSQSQQFEEMVGKAKTSPDPRRV